MSDLLTAAGMRAVERAAIEGGRASGAELMERAGAGVVEAVFEAWPELAAAPHRAVVLCGPGNNGGDGFVVARLLKDRGWAVEVFLLGDPDRLPPDARANCDRWSGMGDVLPLDDAMQPARSGPDLIVDALFGTGLSRAFPQARRLFAPGPTDGPPVVAVDVPSGLCADSGRWLGGGAGPAPRADLTVTFHTAKTGHYLSDGPAACGRLVVKDIGLSRADAPEDGATLIGPPSPGLLSKGAGHKFSHGSALVLSGPAGRSGAARLAARGALRIGAGLVTLGVPGSAQMEVASQITALMLRRVDDSEALMSVLEDRRLSALCLGPGLGVERAAGLIPAALSAAHRPRVVLDADALTALAGDAALFGQVHGGCVLTPHAGEFGRLFPDLSARLDETPERGPAFSRLDATRQAAARAGCVVLLKGPDTVIAAPDGRVAISAALYDRAAPWLATAGAGDVLAGFITGLLARGLGPFEAAGTAAWLHVECARAFGPGLIAEDLPEVLRAAGAA